MPDVHARITLPARRLCVGNIPTGMGLSEQVLFELFNQYCKKFGLQTEHPVVSVWLNSQQTFGFIEFRGVQDTMLALSLFEGLQLNLGKPSLRFGRPVDYKPPPPYLANHIVGDATSVGKEGCDNINIYNVKPGSPAAMLVNELKQRHQHAQTNANNHNNINANKVASDDAQNPVEMGQGQRINCVTDEELKDDEEYADILDDIKTECKQHGKLVDINIPRINQRGQGRVFVKYDTIEAAQTCVNKVNGRKFGDNIVKVCFLDEAKYENQFGGV